MGFDFQPVLLLDVATNQVLPLRQIFFQIKLNWLMKVQLRLDSLGDIQSVFPIKLGDCFLWYRTFNIEKCCKATESILKPMKGWGKEVMPPLPSRKISPRKKISHLLWCLFVTKLPMWEDTIIHNRIDNERYDQGCSYSGWRSPALLISPGAHGLNVLSRHCTDFCKL